MRRYVSIIGIFLMIIFVRGEVLAGDDVVARFGDKKITVSDFNRIIGYVDPERQKIFEKNPQLRETLLRQLVQSMVISNVAKKKGFDNKSGVKEQLKFFTDNYLANEFIKQEVANKVTVSEDDIKNYYSARKDEFKKPEMVKVRHILFKVDPSASESDKKKAKEKAEDILKKIKAGEDFAKLATDVSDDMGSKAKGGDLGFFSRGKMVKLFEDAAFSLSPGDISGIVETQFGYHIIKVEEKKDASIESYEEAKEKISQKLLQERIKSKVNEFIEEAMKDAKAEILPEALTGTKK